MAGADRISLLPDALIHHILSFLPAKEVISSTLTLSKRWQCLWRNSPSLTFNSRDFRDDSQFIEFVDSFFAQKKPLDLVRFKLMWYPYTKTSTFEAAKRWLIPVVEAKPRVLVLNLSSRTDHHMEFPEEIFNCESVEELMLSTDFNLGSCPLKPKSVNLKRLRKLIIEGAFNLNDNFMKKLVHGSPPLEELLLGCQYEGLSNVSLKSLNVNCLKKLKMSGNINLSDCIMKKVLCCCPALEELLLDCKYEGQLNITSEKMNLEHLRTFQIKGEINLDNKFMKNLMRSAPVLEELLLECQYEGLSRISSKSVKDLVIFCHEEEKIEISIPSLLSLHIRGAGKISCKKLGSLVEAYISVEGCEYDDGQATLLNGLRHAEKLQFETIHTMDMFEKELPYCPMFNNLKELSCQVTSFYPIAWFLQHTPALEKLVLAHHMGCDSYSREESYRGRSMSYICKMLKRVEVWYARREEHCDGLKILSYNMDMPNNVDVKLIRK